MEPYIEVCSGKQTTTKNTGFKDQCLESKLLIPILSNGFAFASVDEFKNKTTFKNAIKSKNLVPLFDVYELADASTEDTKFESGNFSKVTAKGVEKITFECFISLQAYNVLKSYEENQDYRELFEFNEGGECSGVFDEDETKVRGRKITSITFTRVRATKDKIPYVKGEITFEDKDDVRGGVVVKSDLTKEDLDGIFDVAFKINSSSATEIKFTANSKYGNMPVLGLADSDLKLSANDGTAQAINSLTYVDGVYTIAGTGLISGTLATAGVVDKTEMFIEAEPVTFTI